MNEWMDEETLDCGTCARDGTDAGARGAEGDAEGDADARGGFKRSRTVDETRERHIRRLRGTVEVVSDRDAGLGDGGGDAGERAGIAEVGGYSSMSRRIREECEARRRRRSQPCSRTDEASSWTFDSRWSTKSGTFRACRARRTSSRWKNVLRRASGYFLSIKGGLKERNVRFC